MSDDGPMSDDDAVLCRWLATLLSAELNADTLASYRQGDAAPLFNLLRERGFGAGVDRLERALEGLVLMPEPELELAADFTEMFLVDGRSAAPPYASLYREAAASLHGQATARMEARLAASGYVVKDSLCEPPDHLAVMLEYLASRLEANAEGSRDNAETPETFVREELSPWLPRFVQRCEKVATASDLYPAVVALTAAYVGSLSQNQ